MPKAKSNGSTALTKWDEKLAALAKTAKQAVSKVGSGGNFISLRGGIMTLDGAAVPENKLRCIVLDSVAENQYYEGAFDPESFAAPTCYAFGRDPSTMGPNPEDVATPINATCKGCPNNEWGSADVGRGKACKEVQRLAIIPEGGMDNVEAADIAYLKVPVTSTKNWAGYVRQLADVYGRPPLAFVSEISIVKEQTNKLPGWHLEFKLVAKIEDVAAEGDDPFTALTSRYDEVSKTIMFPYAKMEEAEEAPAPARRQPAARKAAAPVKRARAAAAVAAPAGVPMAAAPSGMRVGARAGQKAAKF